MPVTSVFRPTIIWTNAKHDNEYHIYSVNAKRERIRPCHEVDTYIFKMNTNTNHDVVIECLASHHVVDMAISCSYNIRTVAVAAYL
jgi:hypothetical protein